MTRARAEEAVVSAACAYEIFAVASGKTPTVSTLCRRYRWAEALLLTGLLVHLHTARAREQGT